jgi:hypothetical protein
MAQEIFDPKDSLELIDKMIRKAKGSYHETGLGSILWGVVVTTCAMITWLQIYFSFHLPFDIWLLTAIAIIPQIIISYQEKKERHALRYEDQALDYIWGVFGIGIFLLVLIHSFLFSELREQAGQSISIVGKYSSSYFLLLYGIPTIITGAIMRFNLMLWGGVVCWGMLIVSLYTDYPTDMLLTALSAICAWLIPGIKLRLRYIAKKAV